MKKDRCSANATYRRFLPEDEYVASFAGGVVPPFLVFQPFVIRNGVKGYMVPCKPDHPEAEEGIEMTANINRHIKDALHYLLAVQEIAARPCMVGKVVDMPTIREHTHKAVMELLTADAILAEGKRS